MTIRTFIHSACLLTTTLLTAMPSAVNAAENYQKQTGNFIKLEFAAADSPGARSLSPGAPAAQLLMLDDNQQIELGSPRYYQHLSAFSGKVKTPGDHAEEEDVIVVKRADGGFLALFTGRQQIIYQPVAGQQTRLTFPDRQTQAKAIFADALRHMETKAAAVAQARNQQDSRRASDNADIDAEGNYVIDMLIGFSAAAAQVAIDPEAYAFAQVESINQALKNSEIDGIKIRLVGTEIINDDYPIVSENVAKMNTAFAKGIEKYSPDLVAGFFVGDKSLNTAAGWGLNTGNLTINNIVYPTVLRHEVGHNAGGHHCSSETTTDFAYGWDNGKSQTIMCGNTSGYYSNPSLKDKFNLPLGDKNKADMARVWREARARMSATRPAIVPLNQEQVTILAEQRMDLNAANNYMAGLELQVPENVKKIVFAALHDKEYLEKGKYTLEVREADPAAASNPSTYTGSDSQYYPSYAISHPAAGTRLYAGVRSEGANLPGILLRVWAFSDDLKNGGAESGDLSGWTLEQGQFRVITSQDNISPAEGKYYFTARENSRKGNYAPTDRISQKIAINPLALTPVATARLDFKSNGWGDGDYGTATLLARDKDGAILSSNLVKTTGKKQEWISYSVDLPLPAQTSQLEIRIDAYPMTGEMNDVHFDNFRFTVDY